MSSFVQQQQQQKYDVSPRANIFLLVNLGCEMLYVIDQRLKAQQIAEDKSIQVIHDITAVLLEPKFVDSIIIGSTHPNAQLLTAENCKFMLKDIATCSLMRLDEPSMEKLWNLMTVIYKWQLYVSKHQHHLLDITFRHLNAIGKMYPDAKISMLIDFAKNTLLDFWNASNDHEQLAIYHTNIAWLQCFNTKISVLIRLGFQSLDGNLLNNIENSYFQEFINTIGENIYVKSVDILAKHRSELNYTLSDDNQTQNYARYDVNQLAEILCTQTNDCEDLKPIDAKNFQQQFEKNLKQCNVLFDDLDVNSDGPNRSFGGTVKPKTANSLFLDLQLFPDSTRKLDSEEFVQMKPIYNRNLDLTSPSASSTSTSTSTSTTGATGLTRDLLDFYSKMK